MTDLMQPRYKVIANYPNSDLIVEDILLKHTFDNGASCFATNPEVLILGTVKSEKVIKQYPHLFKELIWHEERSFEEMPKYLKTKAGFGMVREVKKYHTDNEVVIFTDGKTRKTKNFIPATEDEYNNFINKKE